MDTKIFKNVRELDDTIQSTSADEIKQTVYNNMKSDMFLKHNKDYVTGLSKKKITPEFLLKEFSPNNPFKTHAKVSTIPRIANNFDIIKMLDDNNLLLGADYVLIFVNLLICYDRTIDRNILDFIYSKNKFYTYSKHVVRILSNKLNNGLNDTVCEIFDWYFNNDAADFSKIYVEFIKDKKLQLYALEYLNKKSCMFLTVSNFKILCNICKYCDLDIVIMQINRLISFNKSFKIPYDLLIPASIVNASDSDNIFNHMVQLPNIKFTDLNCIGLCIHNNKFEYAEKIFKLYVGTPDNDIVIKYITKQNDIRVLKLFIENLTIDLHVNNNSMFRYFIFDENYQIIKYFLDNEDTLGKFITVENSQDIQKLLCIIDSQPLIDILTTKIEQLVQ